MRVSPTSWLCGSATVAEADVSIADEETAGPSTPLTPNFLWNLVALADSMRLSLRKGAHVGASSAAWQEIRLRSGRDDKFVWAPELQYPKMTCHPDRSVSGVEGPAVLSTTSKRLGFGFLGFDGDFYVRRHFAMQLDRHVKLA